MQPRNQVRDVIRVEVGEDDVFDVVLLIAELDEACRDPATEVVDEAQLGKFNQYGGSDPLRRQLAASRSEEGDRRLAHAPKSARSEPSGSMRCRSRRSSALSGLVGIWLATLHRELAVGLGGHASAGSPLHGKRAKPGPRDGQPVTDPPCREETEEASLAPKRFADLRGRCGRASTSEVQGSFTPYLEMSVALRGSRLAIGSSNDLRA